MDFDDLLVRFFGTAAIDTLDEERLVAGVERVRLQFALERNRDRRLELWCLLYLLGVAPEPDTTFAEEEERQAARAFMGEADAGLGEAE